LVPSCPANNKTTSGGQPQNIRELFEQENYLTMNAKKLARIYHTSEGNLRDARETVVRDLGRINVYFQSFNVQILEEVPKYDVSICHLGKSNVRLCLFSTSKVGFCTEAYAPIRIEKYKSSLSNTHELYSLYFISNYEA
jgi:hypothetical protein